MNKKYYYCNITRDEGEYYFNIYECKLTNKRFADDTEVLMTKKILSTNNTKYTNKRTFINKKYLLDSLKEAQQELIRRWFDIF